jgi:hypothetical protein
MPDGKTYAPGRNPDQMRAAQRGRNLAIRAYAAQWFMATRPPSIHEVSGAPVRSVKNIKQRGR